MFGFEARLHGHAQACTAPLKTRGVCQNAFDTGDVRRRIPLARDAVAVCIYADRRIAWETAPA
jgi:hypothetical protein